jgi:tetratricopeptide (TPR) repeat protein
LRLKGKRDPVPAYELVGLRSPGAARVGLGDEAPFIGRDAEFGRLIGKLLDVVESGRGSSVVVTGEAGVGKTRLAVELDRFATELPAIRVLSGRCPPYGEGRDLAPLAEWMRVAFGITDADDVTTAETKARRTLARLALTTTDAPVSAATADRLLALLGMVEWAPLGPRDAATPGQIEPMSRDPFVDAVATVLRGLLVDGPLVLVIDDAQWATPDLPRALGRLTDALRGPVLLVVVGRPDLLGNEWWSRLPALEVLPVAPLDDVASERLLRAYLGEADLDPDTRDVILARAQGNPFFLAELLHLLVDRGLLQRVGDGWRLTGELPREVLPAGVQAVLAARIDSLDAAAKAVLRDASIAGTRFTLDMVRALEPAAGDGAVEAGIDELLDRGIVRPADSASEGGRSFLFAHTLAQDVAYAGIPKGERARRHTQLARWATENMPGPAGEIDLIVATQAEQACSLATEMRLPPDDPAWLSRAVGVDALVRLGQAALARDDNVRAEGVFSRAFALADDSVDPGRRDDALIGRAAARVGLHRLDEAEPDLAGPRESTDLRRRSAALVVLGDLLRRRGDVTEAVQALVSALAAASEAGFDRVTGEALRQLGMVDYRSGRLAAAEGRFREALALAQRVGDRRGAGWALQHLAWTATTRGDYELAERTLGEAAEVFAGVDDDGGLSWCAGTEAFVRLLQGRFREARGLARGLLPVGRARDDSWGTAACLTIDAFAAAELGRITAALEQSDTAMGIFRSLGDTWGQALAGVARAAALRGAGRPKDAVKAVRAAVELSQQADQPVTAALALSVLGYCRLDMGDLSGAEDAARRALDAAAPLDLRPAALVGPRVLLGQVHRRRGELKLALPLLEEAEICRDETSLIFPRRQALAHLAGARLEMGDVAGALAVVEDAFAVPAEDVRSRVVALRVLAQVLTAAGDAPAGLFAGRQAVALSGATEMRSELLASEKVVAALR